MVLNNPQLIAWLLDAATLLALALLLASFCYGLALLLVPRLALDVSQKLNRRYSGRRTMRSLEIPRHTERFFYRNHRLVGVLLLGGVFLFFFLYLFDFPHQTLITEFADEWGVALAGAVVESGTWLLVAGNILVGLVALVMIIRPSLLKPVEAIANRWFSTRRALRGVEQERDPLDAFVARRPRLTGALIVVASLYIGVGLLIVAA